MDAINAFFNNPLVHSVVQVGWVISVIFMFHVRTKLSCINKKNIQILANAIDTHTAQLEKLEGREQLQ